MMDSARSLNFKHGGILNMTVYLNFKDGGYAVIVNCNRAVYLNFNTAERLKWRKFQDGGILNMAVCLNIKDGGIFEYD
jgi:hypothetical protein